MVYKHLMERVRIYSASEGIADTKWYDTREDIPDDDAEAVLVIERCLEEHHAARPGLGNYTFS
eukprot:COSAG02_NODE_4565_length_5213_cov_3.488268_5_plen_63_part_00